MLKSDDFPQKAEIKAQEIEKSNSFGLTKFKKGEATFFSAAKIIKTARNERGYDFELTSNVFDNQFVYSHETSMYQMLSSKTQPIKQNLRVEIFDDNIFRVSFGSKKCNYFDYQKLSDADKMLIAKPKDVLFEFDESDENYILKTKKIRLEVSKLNSQIKAFDNCGKLVFKQCKRELFTSDIFDLSIAKTQKDSACFESFSLMPNEKIYGLGERFDHLVRNGKNVDFWNKDAIGTSSTRTYINIPFFLSSNGYGMFLNSSCITEWEIGTLDGSTAGFGVEDESIDYFIIIGEEPSEIIRGYHFLTGEPAMPPVWSFGLWMSRNSYASWDVCKDVAKKLDEYDVPFDVLHLDTLWFKEDWNTDLIFDSVRFANPEKTMKEFLERGIRICCWQNNYRPVRMDNPNSKTIFENEFFIKGADGKQYKFPDGVKGWGTEDFIIDFTNEEAAKWYDSEIQRLIRMGVSSIKTDFGEGIPYNGCFSKIDGKRFHNLYSLNYNRVVSNAIKAVSGENVVWARSGTAGSQRFPIHWGGDSQCTFEGLQGTLKAALSIGLSGMAFFSHDIGGFLGRPTEELYIRWAQFGLLSSHSRCHGCANDREPWTFGETALRIFKKFTKLRYRLLPYIVEQSEKCCKSGKPLVRAMIFENPQDLNVYNIDDQYYFGDNLLIAPILQSISEAKTRKIYLPKGTWIDFFSREKYLSNGEWIERKVEIETIPIFVKGGSKIKFAKERNRTFNKIGEIEEEVVYN